MLGKIKSSFILKKILNNVDNKKRLNSIRFNIKLQRKLNLNLNDYIRLSGKYQKVEGNELKIYSIINDELLFEGKYSNEKKNGKGKEYNSNRKLLFEGEYLNDKRWKGTAKEYDEYTNNLILEYEYINGKIDDKIKEYDKYCEDLLFEGKYLNGKRNGEGKEYKTIFYEKNSDYSEYHYYHYPSRYSSKYKTRYIKIFEGEYVNGERKKGKEYNYDKKLIYEGEYLNGKRHGKGKAYNEEGDLIYEGDYLNGKANGKGKEYNKEGKLIFEGEYSNGKKNGKGKEYDYYSESYWDSGKIYCLFDGEYFNDTRIKGKEYFHNGKLKFEGEYLKEILFMN